MPAEALAVEEDLGEFSQFVPAISTAAPDEGLGEFSQFVPPPDSTAAFVAPDTTDLGEFDQFVPKSPVGEAEKALVETSVVPTVTLDSPLPRASQGERPPLAETIAGWLDSFANTVSGGRSGPDTLTKLVKSSTYVPEPGEPSFTNAGIPVIPQQEGAVAETAAGLANVPIGFANFLLSPGGVATMHALGMAPKLAQTLVGVGFTADQAHQFLNAETTQEKITSGVGAALLGLGTAAGAIKGRGETTTTELPVATNLVERAPQSLETKLPVASESPPEPGTPAASEIAKPALSSERSAHFKGELQNIREELRNPMRKEKIKYADVFKKDAPDPDVFAQELRNRGFNVETDIQAMELVQDRIRTGKLTYGSEALGAVLEPAEVYGFGPGAAASGELPPWRASATAMQERINNLFTRQRYARTPERATRETLRVADKWLEADRDAIRTQLLSFSKHLPLHDRAKFLPAITSAMRRAPILSRDPGVMYRRAEAVLNRMTESVYDVNRKAVIGDIDKLLTKTAESKSMTVPEKETIRERGNTFNALKDKMSFDMLTAMHERMTEIAQKGKELFAVDQVMETERVNATLREIKAQGVRRIDKPEQTRLALGETETAWQRRINQLRNAPSFIKHFNLALTPMDWLIQTFDKVPNGVLYRRLKLPVDVRYGEWLDASHGYKQQLSKTARGLDAGNFDRIYAHAELRQEGGLENLKALGYSEKEINSAKTLTRPELEYLREADRINNELFPVLKDVLAKFFHQEINKVEGYFPRQRDWDYYNTLSIEEGKFARAFNRTNTEKGFTVSRVGATTKNITNAHEVMMNHIDDVLYHIKMGPEIRRLADVVKSKDFANSVGSLGQRVFSDWVDVLSRNGGVSAGRRIHALDILRKNVGVAQLAFRLTTTGLQPLSLIQGMALASPKNISVALSGVMSKARRQFMLDNFPEIRARVGDDPAYSDYGGASMRDKFARGGFKAISVLDRFSALTIGEAAYRDSIAKRGIAFDMTKVDPQAVQEAQLIVRKTQSSAYAKDVPLAISRGNFSGNASVDKAVFQFQNFLVNKWALIKNGALQMGIEDKSVKAGARIATFVILGTIAEQMSRDGIKRLIRATFGTTKAQEKEQEKVSDQSYALQIGEKAAIDLVTSMPVVSNVFGMAKYEGSGIPVLDTLENVIEGATKLASGKKTETKVVGGIRAGQAVGALAGVPTGQAGDILVQAVRAKAKNKSDSSESIPAQPVGLPNL